MSIHREDRGQNGASALLHPSARILATSLERFPFGLKGREDVPIGVEFG
jgi:hypothetical protein